MCLTSRERFLEKSLSTLQWNKALKALDLVRTEMCAEKGYVRHNGTHYYYHLIDVCQKLINFGIRDEEIIIAALLHDIAEDIPSYPIERVRDEYGDRVAAMVDLVTKKKGIDYKKEENLVNYLNKISENYGAALVKTADRMHNFGTLKDATETKKMKQSSETKNYFIPFFKVCRNKYPRYAHIFFEAKTAIEPHLWEIEERYEETQQYKEKIEELSAKIAQYEKELNKKENK